MKIEAIDHVLLGMPIGGEAEARAFYGGVLGMAEIPKPPLILARGGAWFRSGAAELHIGAEEGFQAPRRTHPALRVDDLDAFASRCAEAGYEVEWDDRHPVMRRFYVHDPFGNRLEIVQPREAGS